MLLLRGATGSGVTARCACGKFQYMLLLRGATALKTPGTFSQTFQYMLLLRGATNQPLQHIRRISFQYMLLLRGATHAQAYQSIGSKFQYMLLLRGATENRLVEILFIDVSIHAPLARSNLIRFIFELDTLGFNTCSSCEEQQDPPRPPRLYRRFNTCSSCEEQLKSSHPVRSIAQFQYMLLLRGATLLPEDTRAM